MRRYALDDELWLVLGEVSILDLRLESAQLACCLLADRVETLNKKNSLFL